MDQQQEKVLLTSTTIITLISDVCHNTEYLKTLLPKFKKIIIEKKYKGRMKAIYSELLDEIEKPVIVPLNRVLENKDFYAVADIIDHIEKDVIPICTKSEQEKYKELREKLTIVNSNPSNRISDIEGNRWGSLNKSDFGTADTLNMQTITGNYKAARSLLEQYKFDMKIIVHRPRDIVGCYKLNKIKEYEDSLNNTNKMDKNKNRDFEFD